MTKRLGLHLATIFAIVCIMPAFSAFGGQSEQLSGELAATPSAQNTVPTKKEAPTPSGFAIQTGIFLIKENAQSMVTTLRAKGYEPYIFQTLNDKGQKLYVVRIGEYRSIKQATSAAAQFKSLENLPATITAVNSIKPISISGYLTKTSEGGVISPEELSQIAAGTGSVINADEMARIDGQTGALLKTEELSQIAAQSGTVISSNEMATVDGRTGSVIPSEEMATVDGRTGAVVPSTELATVDGQTGQSIPKGDLSKIRGQAAGVGFSEKDAEPIVLSQKATKSDKAEEDDPFTAMHEGGGGGGGTEESAIDSATARQLKEQIEALQEKVNELREEADVRKILEITEEEKQEEESEILSATGREYTLAKKGSVGFDYSLSYTYNSYDTLTNSANWNKPNKIEHRSQHNLVNSLGLVFAVLDNITLGGSVPFVYNYHGLGTEDAKQVTDLGDASLSLQWQPLKAGGTLPPGILSFGFSAPLGRSPYEVDPNTELSTSSGVKSLTAGLSLNHSMDPVVCYGGISFGHALPVTGLSNPRYGRTLKEVRSGENIGVRFGLGYALSYQLNMNINLSYSYSFGGEYVYQKERIPIAESASANFTLGTGWRLSPTRSINISLSKGLTNDASDFSLSLSIPFNF